MHRRRRAGIGRPRCPPQRAAGALAEGRGEHPESGLVQNRLFRLLAAKMWNEAVAMHSFPLSLGALGI